MYFTQQLEEHDTAQNINQGMVNKARGYHEANNLPESSNPFDDLMGFMHQKMSQGYIWIAKQFSEFWGFFRIGVGITIVAFYILGFFKNVIAEKGLTKTVFEKSIRLFLVLYYWLRWIMHITGLYDFDPNAKNVKDPVKTMEEGKLSNLQGIQDDPFF